MINLAIPSIEIVRLEENFNYGTFGVMKIQKQVFCVTLERPDTLNKSNISSIPAQQYDCVRIASPKFGETFEVTNVPDRTHVLFHSGNLVHDTEGCILLGTKFGIINGNRGILESRNAFKDFLNILNGYNLFNLTIKEDF